MLPRAEAGRGCLAARACEMIAMNRPLPCKMAGIDRQLPCEMAEIDRPLPCEMTGMNRPRAYEMSVIDRQLPGPRGRPLRNPLRLLASLRSI